MGIGWGYRPHQRWRTRSSLLQRPGAAKCPPIWGCPARRRALALGPDALRGREHEALKYASGVASRLASLVAPLFASLVASRCASLVAPLAAPKALN